MVDISLGLVERFRRGLEVSADRPAIRVEGDSLTYAQLDERALILAGALLAGQVRPPTAIGVLAGKSLSGYAALLAGMYTGITVVPLQPAFPVVRTKAMIEAAGVDVLVADEESAAALAELRSVGVDLPVLICTPGRDGAGDIPVDSAQALTAPRATKPEDFAYILFTSGSTGRPKGVPVTQGNCAHYFGLLDDRYDFEPDDVFSQTFDLNFDCAMFDLFCGWGAGATVQALPTTAYRNLPEYIVAQGITVWFSTPSAIALARRTSGLAAASLPSLRWSFFAGEALHHRDAADWYGAASDSVIENIYGPTELTITVAAHRWRPAAPTADRLGTVPIGAIHAGHDYLLLDADGDADRVEGELCIAGPQLTPGYLDPDDDIGRFFDRHGRRYYRTGDRVRRDVEGQLTYLGRKDSQVQVHGIRIELAEVESALRGCAGVQDAVAVAVAVDGSAELAVFYTGAPTSQADLARELRGTLPGAVVPRRYTHLIEFPLNSNRKVDRRELARRAADGMRRTGTRTTQEVTVLDSHAVTADEQAMTVHGVLDEAANAAPTAAAIADRHGRWTYRELADHSLAVAEWLERQGVGVGDRVLVQLPSIRETVAIFYGVSRRGAIFVPLNPAMKDYHLRSVLDSAEPKLVIATGPEAAPCVTTQGPGSDAAAGERSAELAEFAAAPVHELDRMWEQVRVGRVTELPAEVIDPDLVAVLVYTSGSTAAPKGVICPHRQMIFASRAINAELRYRQSDVVFCRFPISWDYGLYKVLLAALGRSELVLADGDADLVLLNRIRESGATVVPIVPSLASMICSLARREHTSAATALADRGRVRMFSNTGAALPESTIEELRAAFPNAVVVRQFGQTECKRISVLPPEFEDTKGSSVGRPLPGTIVHILDESGSALPIGEVGEIVVEGPHVMPGYWRLPEITARTFRPGPTGARRLHTGDYGRLDSDGFLYYVGRRDDMFKRKGVRMSTIEIEAAAMDIPQVRAAAAVPPGEDRDLTIFVEGEIDAHTVLRELSRRLEPQKVPAQCRVVDDIPLTLHGKHARAALVSLVEGAAR
ncbi:AMP-binding protein [Nocardia sp. NPDC051570]|uniref:AMP-binding protein n=1 Tax=Nocardia sp. NPDC051570 TaxID=3364324 RepID=UPI00378FC440